MSGSGFEEAVEQYHRALDAFVRGDPGPDKELFSRRGDVTLANPLGPPARGWNGVEKTMEAAAGQLREGEPIRFERVSGFEASDLAYIVEIERTRGKLGDTDQAVAMALRATTIFRLEDGQWKIVHRHADAITSPRPIETVAEK